MLSAFKTNQYYSISKMALRYQLLSGFHYVMIKIETSLRYYTYWKTSYIIALIVINKCMMSEKDCRKHIQESIDIQLQRNM